MHCPALGTCDQRSAGSAFLFAVKLVEKHVAIIRCSKDEAEFFVATLVRGPQTGAMVTNPSLSPENRHPFGAALCAGPAMDAQVLRDLFAQCIKMGELLGVAAAFGERLAALRTQLPRDGVGRAGQLQEWRQNWDRQAPALHHRHVWHLHRPARSTCAIPRRRSGLA